MSVEDENRHFSEKDKIDFAKEASIAYDLGFDGQHFIDLATGEHAVRPARMFSLLKYGDTQTIQTLAAHLEDIALDNPAFQRFLQNTRTTSGDIFITTPGNRYVPKGAKLLGDAVGERLNVHMSAAGLQPIILDPPVPFDFNDYTNTVANGIHGPNDAYIPESFTRNRFEGHPVIYVSDIYASPEVEQWAKRTMRKTGKAQSMYFLYAFRLDPEIVRKTDGAIVDELTNSAIDGSLSSLKGILTQPNLVVVRRTLSALLEPEHEPYLYDFLMSMPDATLQKVYLAASQSDFRIQHGKRYDMSFATLQRALSDRGWTDSRGRLFLNKRTTPESASATPPYRIVNYTLNSKRDISIEDARRYSRMKYSDPVATQEIAAQMAEKILSDPTIAEAIQRKDKFILTSSAYGSVPTAAAIISKQVKDMLLAKGISVSRVKIIRGGGFETTNFGSLSQAERDENVKARKFSLSPKDLAMLDDATVLAIDDLCATGSHERAVQELMATTKAKQTMFAYYIRFGERLMVDEPDTEEWLNQACIKSLSDVTATFNEVKLADSRLEDKLAYMISKIIQFHRLSGDMPANTDMASWKIGDTLVDVKMSKPPHGGQTTLVVEVSQSQPFDPEILDTIKLHLNDTSGFGIDDYTAHPIYDLQNNVKRYTFEFYSAEKLKDITLQYLPPVIIPDNLKPPRAESVRDILALLASPLRQRVKYMMSHLLEHPSTEGGYAWSFWYTDVRMYIGKHRMLTIDISQTNHSLESLIGDTITVFFSGRGSLTSEGLYRRMKKVRENNVYTDHLIFNTQLLDDTKLKDVTEFTYNKWKKESSDDSWED